MISAVDSTLGCQFITLPHDAMTWCIIVLISLIFFFKYFPRQSPLPSYKNIAQLMVGAAGAVSNNEKLAYQLQAVELEISLVSRIVSSYTDLPFIQILWTIQIL